MLLPLPVLMTISTGSILSIMKHIIFLFNPSRLNFSRPPNPILVTSFPCPNVSSPMLATTRVGAHLMHVVQGPFLLSLVDYI